MCEVFDKNRQSTPACGLPIPFLGSQGQDSLVENGSNQPKSGNKIFYILNENTV